MRPGALLLGLALACGVAAPASGRVLPEVSIVTTRLHFGDVVPHAPPEAADLDLGPAPCFGCSRLITRDELRHLLDDAKITAKVTLPDGVRVTRKGRTLGAPELEKMLREAMTGAAMFRGVTIASVRAPRATLVPAGWDTVLGEVPRPPHRAGPVQSTVSLTLLRGQETLIRLFVPVELALGPEAMKPDLAKGAPVTLTLRRGMVEVSVAGRADADADVGGPIFPVVVRPSGRVLRARLLDKDHAEVVDGS
jgi:hypothetical protein